MAPALTSKRRMTPEMRAEQLLDAAARVLEQGGTERFTTNAVAKAAAVGVGTIYKAYLSADMVLLALMAQDGIRFTARLQAIAERDGWRPAAGRLVDAVFAHSRARPKLASALYREELRLQVCKPRGLLAAVEDASFTVLEASPVDGVDLTSAARCLAAMLCAIALSAAQAHASPPDRLQLRAGVLGYIEGLAACC